MQGIQTAPKAAATVAISPSEVAVVLLNYNGRRHLERFLPSVCAHSQGARIIVADNGSTDNSVLFLQEHYTDIELILLPENCGYAGGYNRALQQVHSQYAVLLNSDVEVTAGWLPPLLEVFAKYPSAAAVQPKLRSLNEPAYFEYAGAAGGYIDRFGYPFCRGRLFDTLEPDAGQYNNTVPVAWASGACLAVRLPLFKKAGGFDDLFFAHMEEIDLCLRFINRGYSVWACGNSHVYHLGGGTLHKSNPRKTFLNFRNGLLMMLKNGQGYSSAYNITIRLVLDGIAGLRFLAQGNFPDFLAVIRAHFAFYAQIPRCLAWRRREKVFISGNVSEFTYPGSVVWAYFGKKVKQFGALDRQPGWQTTE